MKQHSRFAVARIALIVITLFVGIGAVAGTVCMLIDPTGHLMGMDKLLLYFQVLPFAPLLFQDYTFSGISLLIVNGITNLAAAALILARKPAGTVLGGIFGITLMLWICIQFVIFPPNLMDTLFFTIGACQAACGYAAWVFCKQESFSADIDNYPNIGVDPSRLVVFFSRMGYVKKLAYEEANRTGAAIFEITSPELTAGTAGFWWCGRYGMHRWAMPIDPVPQHLESYRHVTICSPIWVFALAAPVRAFCQQATGRIASADYVLVHHTAGRYASAADEMDALLGIKHTALRSIQCQRGVYKTELDE